MTTILSPGRVVLPGQVGTRLSESIEYDVMYDDSIPSYCTPLFPHRFGDPVTGRAPTAAERRMMEDVDVNPDDFYVLRIRRDRFAPVSDIQPGQWFSWGSLNSWYRLTSLDSDGTHHYDARVSETRTAQSTDRWLWSDIHDCYTVAQEPPWPVDLSRLDESHTEEPDGEVVVNEPAVTDLHRRDLEIISRILMEEANAREWCGEYDQVIERINAQITGTLAQRTQQFAVRVTVAGAGEQFVTLTATSRDAAARTLAERIGEIGPGGPPIF